MASRTFQTGLTLAHSEMLDILALGSQHSYSKIIRDGIDAVHEYSKRIGLGQRLQYKHHYPSSKPEWIGYFKEEKIPGRSKLPIQATLSEVYKKRLGDLADIYDVDRADIAREGIRILFDYIVGDIEGKALQYVHKNKTVETVVILGYNDLIFDQEKIANIRNHHKSASSLREPSTLDAIIKRFYDSLSKKKK